MKVGTFLISFWQHN